MVAQELHEFRTDRDPSIGRRLAVLLRVRGGLKSEQRKAVTAMDGELLEVVSQPGSEGPSGDTP